MLRIRLSHSRPGLPVFRALFLSLLLAAGTSACRGSGDDAPPAPVNDPGPGGGGGGGGGGGTASYSIGGTVSGLTGSGLGLDNHGDILTIDAGGAFVFGTELADGAAYDVQITAQPKTPANYCTVSNGSGSISGADVTDIEILCTGPLALTSATPGDGDTLVSRSIAPVLKFSADLDAAAVVAGTVALVSEAGEVAVTVDVAGNTLTLTPTLPLLPLTGHVLTVSTDLLGSSGERLEDPVELAFRTRDGAWSAEVAIDTINEPANDAQIAWDSAGNAIAVWYQEGAGGGLTNIWSNHYTAGVGWGTAELVEQNDRDFYAGSPRVLIEDGGAALVVWTQTVGLAGGNVWSNRYEPGTGWGKPELVDSEAGDVIDAVELAGVPGRGAVAAWAQIAGSAISIHAGQYDPVTGWGALAVLDTVDTRADRPRVAMDADGNALVAWEQIDGNFRTDVMASRMTKGTWGAPELVSTTNNNDRAGGARIAFDTDGNALLVYWQEDGFDSHMHAARYSPGNGWQTPVRIGPLLSGTVSYADIAIAPDGSALATWEQPVAGGGAVVITAFSARYTPAGGWETATPISIHDVFYPKVSFDPSGNALAVWYQLDFTRPPADAYSVWGNRYVAGNGWGSPERIGSHGNLIGTFMPNLAVAPNGDALAIWTQMQEVRVSRFE